MRLPTIASELVYLSVRNAREINQDSRYRLNGKIWHRNVDGICNVCLTGSVIAITLSCHINQEIEDVDVSAATLKYGYHYEALSFIEEVRLGKLSNNSKYLSGCDEYIPRMFPTEQVNLLRSLNELIVSTFNPESELAPLRVYEYVAKKLAEAGY